MRNYYASLISWSSVMIVVFACFTLNVNFIIASIFIAAIMDMFDGKVQIINQVHNYLVS
jgi:phosphatidylserine synthase